jgi:hypothetical protein
MIDPPTVLTACDCLCDIILRPAAVRRSQSAVQAATREAGPHQHHSNRLCQPLQAIPLRPTERCDRGQLSAAEPSATFPHRCALS